jgi:hypothetical protein
MQAGAAWKEQAMDGMSLSQQGIIRMLCFMPLRLPFLFAQELATDLIFRGRAWT